MLPGGGAANGSGHEKQESAAAAVAAPAGDASGGEALHQASCIGQGCEVQTAIVEDKKLAVLPAGDASSLTVNIKCMCQGCAMQQQ